jgi:iron complex outermembrane receptor protein
LTGRDAYENSFSLASVMAGAPEKAEIDLVKPEQVTAFEFGYRGVVHKVVVDFSAYYNVYKDFIGNKTVLTPFYGEAYSGTPDTPQKQYAGAALQNEDYQAFQTYTNSKADISSYGAAIGLRTKVMGDFDLGMNYTYAKFDFDQSTDPDYEAGFNTPEHKVKVSFGNSNLGKNIGFRVDARWNDAYLWESTFLDAMLPARTTIDAQVTYSIPQIKSVVKLGAANLMGHEYLSAPGAGSIGSQVYASWTVRNF